MYGMKTEAEKHQEAEMSRTGGLVREARTTHEGAEEAIKNNRSKTLEFHQAIQNNNMEMEILGDFDELNTDLKKKFLDLQDANKSYDNFIGGLEKEIPALNHASKMAEVNLNRSQNDYQDARNMGQDSDGITSNEREKLSKMSMVNMDFDTKMKWAGRLGGGETGLKKLREIVPMI